MMFEGDFEGEKVRNQEAAPPLRVSLPGNQVDGLPDIAVQNPDTRTARTPNRTPHTNRSTHKHTQGHNPKQRQKYRAEPRNT